jgi:hypothetical protein
MPLAIVPRPVKSARPIYSAACRRRYNESEERGERGSWGVGGGGGMTTDPSKVRDFLACRREILDAAARPGMDFAGREADLAVTRTVGFPIVVGMSWSSINSRRLLVAGSAASRAIHQPDRQVALRTVKNSVSGLPATLDMSRG